jgi:hypothetical protein
MHYEDLTIYEYHEGPPDVHSLNVGWLGGWGEPFAQGETSQAFKERLFQFCLDRYAVHLCRGYHECEFCGGWHDEAKAKYGEGASCLSIGNGEIRVIGTTAVYAAPALVYHYVVRHAYRPPDCFIEAVLTGPAPGSEEHEALLNIMRWGRAPFKSSLPEQRRVHRS